MFVATLVPQMNLTWRIIAAIGQATAPYLSFEIMASLGLVGVMVRHFTARAFQETVSGIDDLNSQKPLSHIWSK